MGSLSDYAELELIDHSLGTAYTPPAAVYVGLSTADPLDTAAGLAEATYTGYAREALTLGAAASRRTTQSALLTFDQCTAGSSTVTHWAIFDALTAGNMLAHGALGANKNIVSGNTPSVASGEIYVEFSAGYIADYLANKLLDLMFRNQAYSAPSTYVGLVTATTSDDDTGTTVTEPSGNGYARKQVNANGGAAPDWTIAASGAAENDDDIDFTDPTGSWGTIVGIIIADAATVGNLLFYDNGTTDQAVGSDDTVSIPAGDLDVSMS